MFSFEIAAAFLFALTLDVGVKGASLTDISEGQWEALNATVSGRLFIAAPISRPCFSNVGPNVTGQADEGGCEAVMQTYLDPETRSNTFGAFMNTEWETCQATSQQCLLDFTDPANAAAFSPPQVCAQGSVPRYYIDVREPADVQAAFDFARSTGVPLTIKNSGHDYSGRSSGADTLGLWITYAPAFVPEGCDASQAADAVTFGAGVSQGALYNFADGHNITLPGGGERSVAAAGGYLQGILSNAYGLAVDRVFQVKVVVPTGEYLTANACQNTDLFFALRGGGGGTFGVVMEATTRALPQTSLPTVLVQLNGTQGMEREWLDFIAANAIAYAQTGWGGVIAPGTGIVFTNPLINMSQATAEMAGLEAFATNQLKVPFSLTLQPTFLSLFNEFLLPNGVPVGLPFLATSRLIPADNFQTESQREELLDRLIPVLANSQPLIFAVAPFYFKDDGETSVTPAWRNSIWHVTASAFWNYDTSLEEKRKIYANASSNMDALREITLQSGAYFNEADVHEPNFETSFWGTNYDRLLQIKQKYDPDHLLDCWQCVGWSGASSARFSCYI
ncbi:FAD-binding domain-containing protein [Cubamyces sp. BRFM 1775]|nr:FAD-binding domain-containing protein [Cubamyces sp. BRFM 1775]